MPVFNNMLAGASGAGGGGYEIDRSLRFNSGDSSNLSKTFASAGNKKTWTWSAWVKFNNNTSNQVILNSADSSSNFHSLYLQSDGTLKWDDVIGGSDVQLNKITNQVFRDFSAWYHLMLVVDTTNGTAANRNRMYVNGVQATFASGNDFAQNDDSQFNQGSAFACNIGSGNNATYSSVYLAEIQCLDGTAASPSDFGETDSNGVWQPKEFTGNYIAATVNDGTVWSNSLTSQYTLTNAAKAFNGSTSDQAEDWDGTFNVTRNPPYKIEFTPPSPIAYSSSVRVYSAGGPQHPYNNTISIDTGSGYGSAISVIQNNWVTVATGSGSLTKLKAEATQNGTNLRAIEIDGVILQDGTPTNSFHLDFSDNSSNAALGTDTSGNGNTWTVNNLTAAKVLNATAGTFSGKAGISFDGVNDDITLTAHDDLNPGSGVFTFECYAYASSSGSNEFGIYDGSPGGGGSFVIRRVGAGTLMVERADQAFDITGGQMSENTWHHVAVTRDSSNNVRLFLDGTQSGSTSTSNTQNYSGTFRMGRTNNAFTNGYISNVRLIKGTALYTSNFTAPTGNLSNVTNTKLLMAQSASSVTAATVLPTGVVISGNGDVTGIDSLVDTPEQRSGQTDTGVGNEIVGNYATLNPLHTRSDTTFSDGNLRLASATYYRSGVATIPLDNGKWYFEGAIITEADNGYSMIGVTTTPEVQTYAGANSGDDGFSQYSASGGLYPISGNYTPWGVGDIASVAYDSVTRKTWIAKNGTWQNSGDPAAGTGSVATIPGNKPVYFSIATGTNGVVVANFGQRAFAYTAPSGYKCLCTANLPDPTIADGSTAFDTKLYTGNGGTQNITGLNFSPELTWIKTRSGPGNHHIFDVVRGVNKSLHSDTTAATETTTAGLTAFNSNGFSIGNSNNDINGNGITFVSWNWDAGSSNTTIAAGSISSGVPSVASTVRANPSAGFSIVSWSSASNAVTVSHGLNAAPKIYIVKDRNNADGWVVVTTLLTNTTDYLYLNTTAAAANFGVAAPTSSTFIPSQSANSNYIAYCFAPVEGYSAMGSYTGNGSADGPFVYTGHSAAWVMIKRTDAADEWIIYDNERNTFNSRNTVLKAQSSSAEVTNVAFNLDFLSNGFKPLANDNGFNASGGTYVYLSFASHPFKTARAR